MEYINKMLAKENPAPLCDLTPHFLHRVGDSLFSAFVVKTADRKRLAEALKHSHPDVPHWATVKAGAWPRAHVPSAEGGPGGALDQDGEPENAHAAAALLECLEETPDLAVVVWRRAGHVALGNNGIRRAYTRAPTARCARTSAGDPGLRTTSRPRARRSPGRQRAETAEFDRAYASAKDAAALTSSPRRRRRAVGRRPPTRGGCPGTRA
ncbi:hypothetical protein JL722_1662 [Aureococcus anophagefferens]|nr:hypothetical protein JL722_1662 [Aureococcus anophagefferens]